MKIIITALLIVLLIPEISLASGLEGPTCKVKAQVIEQASAKGELKVKILSSRALRLSQVLVSCSFVAKGKVFSVNGDKEALSKLALEDVLQAGVESASSMGPNGPVSFIHWQPVTVQGSPEKLPSSFTMDSPLETEK